jgi:hypothetical protein
LNKKTGLVEEVVTMVDGNAEIEHYDIFSVNQLKEEHMERAS